MTWFHLAIGSTVLGVLAVVLLSERFSERVYRGAVMGFGICIGRSWQGVLGLWHVSFFYDLGFMAAGVGAMTLLSKFARNPA